MEKREALSLSPFLVFFFLIRCSLSFLLRLIYSELTEREGKTEARRAGTSLIIETGGRTERGGGEVAAGIPRRKGEGGACDEIGSILWSKVRAETGGVCGARG